MRIDGPFVPNPHYLRGTSHTDVMLPTGAIAETFSRLQPCTNTGALTSGRENLTAVFLQAGRRVTAAQVLSATTALVTGTHQWFSLRDSSRNLLAVTSNDVATAWSANSLKRLDFSRTVTDAAIETGTAILSSATAAFTQSDVGARVVVMAAGAASAPLGSSASPVTIASVESATACTLSANAGTTVASGGTAYIGTPYQVTTSGLYYLGIMVAASTVPSVAGTGDSGNGKIIVAPVVAGQDATNTGLTTPATAPGTSAVLAAQSAFYGFVQ